MDMPNPNWQRDYEAFQALERSRQRRVIVGLPLVVALAFSLVSTCAPPPTIQTPEGKKVWTANEVVIRINEFQEAVISAYDLGSIPKDTAETLVTWTVRSLRTIKALPDGWLQTVSAGWREVRGLIPADSKLGALVLVLNLALGG